MAKNIRVAVYAFSRRNTGRSFSLKHNMEDACAGIRRAADAGADLVVLPEIFAVQNAKNWIKAAEPLDGNVITALSREARRLGVCIAAGHPTLENQALYNSIVFIDRKGKIGAVYHKMFPTIWELQEHVQPGQDALVAETELGRIGFAVCYDLNFAELRLAYRDQHPDLILFCSAFRGGLQSRWWAYETRCYFLTCCIDPKSLIVNPLGRIIAETDTYTREMIKPINLDYAVVHLDYSNQNLWDIYRNFGRQYDFEWADPEGVFMVTAPGPQSVETLIKKAGWETAEKYFANARKQRERALQGLPIADLPHPWQSEQE